MSQKERLKIIVERLNNIEKRLQYIELNFLEKQSMKSDNCRSEREKIIDKIKEINEKSRNDPETIKRKQELYEELSKLTSEDLSKRITSTSDKLRKGG